MSSCPVTAPHGAWESPVAASLLAADSVRLGGLALDAGDALWVEGRPTESGRSVLVRCAPGGRPLDMTPPPWNVRSRVHEYGGGAFAVRDRVTFLVNDGDQRLYRLDASGEATALTPEGACRHADPHVSPCATRVVCVREEHRGHGEPENTLVVVDAGGGGVTVVARGHDFYACPRFSPDGRQLAFIAWDHPNMPWDGTWLYLAPVAPDGAVGAARVVAGGAGESVFQPHWSPRGELWFASDAPGYWNLHRLAPGGPRCMLPEAAEFGLPQWQFAMSTYSFVAPDTLAAASCRDGRWQVETIHLPTMERRAMPYPVNAVSALVAGDGCVLLLAGSATQSPSVLRWHPERGGAAGTVEVLRTSAGESPGPEWVSEAEPVDFETADGDIAHGFFYAPRNPRFRAPGDERPPLLVVGHGGPTGATTAALDMGIQFWTSRGFAVFDVNYRGSTGYGRAYRQPLEGNWGIADVADCVNGARHLARTGRVDGARMAIRGRSAGGYTVLAALTFHDVFAAGASYYGIADLEALARDTHKFESRYMDHLVGPYPEQAERYRARSPIHHVDGLSCPVIFFQGLEDAVVPPNQAEMMRDALKAKGLPVACLMFEGEQHGFRRAETIVRCLEAELGFYGQVFGFQPAGDPPPICLA